MIKSIQLEHTTMEYLLTGEKNSETILFVHGLGANLSQFELQQRYFSKKFKVLSVNLRGHGNTLLPPEPTSSDVELYKMAEDIVMLLEKLGVLKIHYVGNSMGGNVGFEILKVKPNLLKTITTFGTTGQLKTSGFAQGIMKLMHKIISPTMRSSLSKLAGQTRASKNKIKEMMAQVNKTTLLSIIPVLANFNYLDVIKNSKNPYLLIKGGKDSEINKAIKTTISEFESRGNFELSVMNSAGHFANLDNPELFNQLLEEFILKHS